MDGMKKIVIVGAGHLGVDVYDVLAGNNRVKKEWEIVGFLNDFPVDLTPFGIEEKVIGPVNGWTPRPGEYYVLAIGNMQARMKLADGMKAKGAEFPVIISHHALVSRFATIGEGTIIVSTSKVARGAKVGRFATIGDATIGQNAVIGDFTNVASYVNVYQDVHVGNRAQLWSTSVILNSVGDDAVVGAGSIVVAKVKAGTKVFGNPAKRLDV